MTAHETLPESEAGTPIEDDGPLAQLSTVTCLVEEMAGARTPDRSAIDDRAITAAYRRAPSVARRRFDRLAREAAQIATVGVEALVEGGGSQRAAADLAAVLRRSMQRLSDIVA